MTSGADRTWLREGSGLLHRAGDPIYDTWITVGQVPASEASTEWQSLALPDGLSTASVLPAAGQSIMAQRSSLPAGKTAISALKIGPLQIGNVWDVSICEVEVTDGSGQPIVSAGMFADMSPRDGDSSVNRLSDGDTSTCANWWYLSGTGPSIYLSLIHISEPTRPY